MDDYNVSVLSEAKNEYSLRLVTILYPLFLEGIKSILKEAWELCLSNDEEEKYLMTFQNFLSRVTKWNQTLIDEETTRIISKSSCYYLEDLLTCVHITQLKILTSIRVSQKQKKIELDIPKLSDFIHKVYIKCARKFYINVYLFEQKVPPLQYQKNMRECETICKECILNVIRDNMPVEHILRSYMDESVEEEIIEEVVEEVVKDVSNNVSSTVSENVSEKKSDEEKLLVKKSTEVASPVIKSVDTPLVKSVSEVNPVVPSVVTPVPEVKPAVTSVKTPVTEVKSVETPVAEVKSVETPVHVEAVKVLPTIKATATTVPPTPPPTPVSTTPLAPTPPVSPRRLSFNNVDRVFNRETLKEELVPASKDIERLEQISRIRNAQRKAEEDDEDNIKIHGEDANIELDIQQL